MLDDKERQKIMEELATKWREEESSPIEQSRINSWGPLNIYFSLFWVTIALCILGGAIVFMIFQGVVALGIVGFVLAAVFGGAALFMLRYFTRYIKDIIGEQTTLVGFVYGKETKTDYGNPYAPGKSTTRSFEVAGISFKVSKAMYNWVSDFDEIRVTYWPRTKTLCKASKTGIRGTREEWMASVKGRMREEEARILEIAN